MKLQLLTASLLLGLASSFQTTYLPSHAEILSISPTILYQSSSDESSPASNRISIEYCTGCKWMLRAFWTAQELLTTFEDDLDAVTVVPSASKGIYAVVLNNDKLLWDRKERGGFPSQKSLKQIVRDLVEPEKFLGHSDSEERQQSYSEDKEETELDMISREDLQSSFIVDEWEAPSPSVAITYCTGCKWLLRAAYFGQELQTTFAEEIKSVSLVPSKPPAKGGRFSVHLDGELIFDRATEGRFPEVKELKQLIRDKIVPDKDLGHSDVQEVADTIQEEDDEDETLEQRRFFGVD